MIQVCVEERYVESLLDGSYHRGWFTEKVEPGTVFESVVMVNGYKRACVEWQTGLILTCVTGDAIQTNVRGEWWTFYKYTGEMRNMTAVELDDAIRSRRARFPDELPLNPNARLLAANQEKTK